MSALRWAAYLLLWCGRALGAALGPHALWIAVVYAVGLLLVADRAMAGAGRGGTRSGRGVARLQRDKDA